MNKSNAHLSDLSMLRQTKQFLLPLKRDVPEPERFNIYPSFTVAGKISTGFELLSTWIVSSGKNVMIDGFGGVLWNKFIESLQEQFIQTGVEVNWIDMRDFQKKSADLNQLLNASINKNDALFGKIYEGDIADFFDLDAISKHKINEDKDFTIAYGCGAALFNFEAKLIYLDLPKNEIQFRSRAGQVANLGFAPKALHAKEFSEPDPKEQYKYFYFIDWPVLNKHKRNLLPRIDMLVDEQRVTDISWIGGDDMRAALAEMSAHMFRARPWFEPGVWGGQWIKNKIEGLNKDVPNYAWSFELISPENGIILEHERTLLELSFDFLLFHRHKEVLGKAARRFGFSFPIRFDFLDTMDGGNLSLQCHPTVPYTKEHFGEEFTQDETYYILEAKKEAEVYLGFQENIEKNEFKKVLEASFTEGEPVDVTKYIQTFPARKHDLFLIPNGTVHCSGEGNLVLEISATPYIYTFKMYDWMRPDLNGNPRTLNIERAFANLDFSRKGSVVHDTLLSKQSMEKRGEDYQIINLSTHPQHFYAIQRLEFDTSIFEETLDQCHILNLVEGEAIEVLTQGRHARINYAETFIIPASAGSYTLINKGSVQAKVIRSFVKDEYC